MTDNKKAGAFAPALDITIAARSVAECRLVAAAVIGRLEGDTAMEAAIGLVLGAVAAAEEEVRARRIADRPVAGALVELQQRLALLDRDLQQFRFRLDLVVIGQRGVAADLRALHPDHVA